MEDDLDGIMPGTQVFLRDFAIREEPADEAWRSNQAGKHSAKWISTENFTDLWRSFKTLTEREAKNIGKSVEARDGCLAWQTLSGRFEQGVEARTGIALTELGDLN